MQPEKRYPLFISTTLPQAPPRWLPAADLLGDLLRGEHAGVGASDDVERGALDLGPERGRGILDDAHAVFAIHAAHDRGEYADIGHGAGQDQMCDAAGAERRVEDRAVEAIVVELGDHRL